MQTHLKKQFRFMAVCFALLLGSLQIAEAQTVSWCQTARKGTAWSSGTNTSITWYSTSTYKYCGVNNNYYYAPVLSVTGASSLTSGGTLTITFSGSASFSATYTVYAVTACGTGTSLNLSTNLGSATSSTNTVTISVGSGIASASYIAIVSSTTTNYNYRTFSSATLTAGSGGGSTCSATTFATNASKTDATATITQKNALTSYSTAYLWAKTPGSSSYSYTGKSTSFWSSSSRGSFTYTMSTSGTYYFVATSNSSTTPTDACGNIVSLSYTAPTCTAPSSVAINPSASYICPGTTTSVTINATGGTCTDGWQYSFNGDTYSATNTRSGVTAGSYTATVRCGSSNTCSTASPSTTINSYVTPEVTISGTAWVCPGGSTQLTASGASSYTWSPTTGVSDPNIENPIFTPSSTTTYTVTGLDGHDCAITASREIAVNDDISISAHPTDASVCYGETDNLSVTATGTGTLTYAWQYSSNNGINWTDAPGTNNTDTYALPTTLAASNDYKFKVTVSNACGSSETSNESAVTVNEGTAITAQPADAMVCFGETDNLNVTATGAGVMTYAWKYSNDGGANWTDAPGSNNTATYALPTTLATGGNHQYKVIVGSECGDDVTSNVVTVTVNAGAAIIAEPTDVSVCEGGTDNLSVTAIGTGTLTYAWKYSNDDGNTWADAPGTNNTDTYALPTTLAADNYKFKVIVGSDCGDDVTSDVASVLVNAATAITYQPDDISVCEGATDDLSVVATGTGTITYAWKYSSDNGNTWADAPGTNNTDVYSIPTTLAIGEHQYKVIIGSECGDDVTSDVAIVTVEQPTGITTQPENTSVCVGSSDDLYVEATGAGTITYAWKYSDDDGANWTDAPGTNDEDTYTLPTTLALGDYKFKVIVGSDCGDDVTSDVAVVSVVYTGPSITTQPSNTTVCVGSSEDLEVEATGIGTLDYAWMYSDDNGNTWNTAGGTYDEEIYELPTTLAVGSHQYKVVVGAECGDDVVSNVVTVTVNALPSVTINGENAYATTTVSGTSVDLTAAGADSYEWAPNTEISANIGASITATPTATRTYTVTGSQTTAGTTCTATATADITVQYKITVLANNDSYGSVTGNNTVVDDGGSADISAIPATGYHFVEWNDADNNAARTITGIHANATYTATFAVNSYTISVESADISMGSVTGGDSYNYGNTATITAIPTSGYRFVEWNDHNTDNPREVLVTKDSLFTATFGDGSMDITVLPNNPEMGIVTGSGTYDYMSTATITAVPNDGYCFVRWADNNIMSNRKVTVTGAKTYYAIFEPRTYRITTKNDEKGTVTGGGNYKFNETVTITAIPNEGCHFEKWSNGSTENPITFNATKNEVFSAVFSATACKLEVQANDSKMGTVTGAGTFDYNKTVTIKANPRNGYEFVKWEDGSTDVVRNITLTQDTLLTANFAALTYTLATDVNNPAMGSVEGAGNYEFATKATLTAKANIGYRFIEWHDGNSTNPRTITIYGDTTYTATFAESKYIVSVKLDNKQGKVTGAGNYDYNSTATLSVTPAEGFLFDSWADGNTDNPRTITVTQDTLLTVNMVSIKPFSENSLFFEVVSVSPATVKVRPENTKRPYYTNEPSGDVVIPETITNNGTTYTVVAIGEMAFRYCKNITSIKLPETVTRIEDYAFTDCSGLEQINIPASVEYVGKHAFRRCVQLTEAPMGEGVETINDYAYCNLNVETFVIPANVKTLGFAVFRYANKLKKVVCNATVPPTVNTQGGEFTKYDVPLYVPAGSINAYKSHAEWGKFKTINAIE